MSAEDYDQAEKLFCGTWNLVRDENTEEFMTAAGMSDEMKTFVKLQRTIILTRVGNSFLEKVKVGDGEFELTKKLNEEIEWKDKEENPLFHVKITPSFKDGIWRQVTTLLSESGGTKHVSSGYIQGDELILELTAPDVTAVTGRRIFQRA